jgi:hypothetical protein
VLKYAAVLAIQNFARSDIAKDFPETDALIRNRLGRPHLGDWAGFLREVLRAFAERPDDLFCRDLFLFHFRDFGPRPRPQPHFTDEGASGRLLVLRNRLAHGATVADNDAAALIEEHKNDLHTLLNRSEFLNSLPLYHVLESARERGTLARPFMGAEFQSAEPVTLKADALVPRHLAVHNPQAATFLDLYPLLVFTECAEEVPHWDRQHRLVGREPCRRAKVLFYNDLKGDDRISFLDYWQGHHSRFRSPNPMPGEFLARFAKTHQTGQKAQWFDDFISYHTEHFVGRDAELEGLDRFAAGSTKRALVVEGAPGMGKSALLSRWAADRAAIRHFVREGDAATYEPARVFENLALQLAARFQLPWKTPSSPEPAAYRQAFEEMLGDAAGKSSVIVVIDGLDEAVRATAHGQGAESSRSVLDWLPDPLTLPERARLVVSTRPDLLAHPAFASKFGSDKAQRLDLDRLTDADVRALLFQVRSKYEVLEAHHYLDAIVERSEGSPLYLRMLLEDLAEGRLAFGEVEALPRGLVAYFERVLEFMELEGRSRDTLDAEPALRAKRETLDSLVAQGLLTKEQVSAQLERERAAMEGRAPVKAIELLALYCLAREPMPLALAATILGATGADTRRAFDVIRTVLADDGRGRCALFHTGFRQYFLHLGDYTETKLHRHAPALSRIRDRLLAYCARWLDHGNAYALRHFAEHLREAHDTDALYDLARDQTFLRTQAETLVNEPHAPLATLQSALRAATAIDDAPTLAEFVLAHARLLESMARQSPLGALRAGKQERAWALADLCDIEQCVVWYLLMAWELDDGGKKSEAKAALDRLRGKALPCLSDWRKDLAIELLAKVSEIDRDLYHALRRQLLDARALESLCERYVKEGELAEAFEAAQDIGDARGRSSALRKVALAQARSQGADPAQTVLLIDDLNERSRTLIDLAEAYAGAEQWEAARKVLAVAQEAAARLDRDWERDSARDRIGQLQARSGDFDAALATIQAIASEFTRTEAMRKVASLRAKGGKLR